jgi:hypothetical protein
LNILNKIKCLLGFHEEKKVWNGEGPVIYAEKKNRPPLRFKPMKVYWCLNCEGYERSEI